MKYQYSETNLMVSPHNYMYAPFQGAEFMQAYYSSRAAILHRELDGGGHAVIETDRMLIAFSLRTLERSIGFASIEGDRKLGLHLRKCVGQSKEEESRLHDLAKGLAKINVAESVSTLSLLHALVANQLTNIQDSTIKDWLDRLVQRFEVTKKLYELYPSNFRKGEGESTSVRLYWLFSLALSLFYIQTDEIKYLSTLLKVNDLLCSLPQQLINANVPEQGLTAVLATEVASVSSLLKKMEFVYASK